MSGLLDLLPDPSKTDHATLYMLRERIKNQALQDQIAGYEHRAFAREAVGENPLMAIPIGLAAPLYQASKFLPGSKSRSNPSLWQLGQAYQGIGEGLLSSWGSKWRD
jgi:hypothetical protein